MPFGLSSFDYQQIIKAIRQFPEIDKCLIFGSRAMGNYKKGSDIDLAVIGRGLSSEVLSRLSAILNEELPLPYFFDVVALNPDTSKDLAEHIRQFGKLVVGQCPSN